MAVVCEEIGNANEEVTGLGLDIDYKLAVFVLNKGFKVSCTDSASV